MAVASVSVSGGHALTLEDPTVTRVVEFTERISIVRYAPVDEMEFGSISSQGQLLLG